MDGKDEGSRSSRWNVQGATRCHLRGEGHTGSQLGRKREIFIKTGGSDFKSSRSRQTLKTQFGRDLADRKPGRVRGRSIWLFERRVNRHGRSQTHDEVSTATGKEGRKDGREGGPGGGGPTSLGIRRLSPDGGSESLEGADISLQSGGSEAIFLDKNSQEAGKHRP